MIFIKLILKICLMNELVSGILMAEYDVIFYEDAYFEGLLYN